MVYSMPMRFITACFHIQRSLRSVALGAASVAAEVAHTFGDRVDTKVIDLYLDEPFADQVELILSSGPDVLGLSVYLWNRRESLELIEAVKASLPDCLVIVGGSEPTGDRQSYLDNELIDHVLLGEAESSCVALFDHLLTGRELREPVTEPALDTLTSPYLSGAIDLRDRTGVLLELSRGCPFSCTFCFESRGHRSLRRFSSERVEKELALFVASGIQEVFILDPTFNFHKEIAKENLRRFFRIAPEIHYSLEARAEFLDDELADLFSQLYCTLQIGLQSTNPKALKLIGRTFDPELFSQRILLLHQRQIPYGFDLIYGLPGDSLEDFKRSIDFVFSLAPNHIDIFPLAVLPGTELYERAGELGLEYDPDNDYLLIKNESYTPEMMEISGRIARAADLFYNQGMAVSWFDFILEALGMNPHEFFLGASSLPLCASALEYQRQVLLSLFEEGPLARLACDIAEYFFQFNSLDQQDEGIDLGDGSLLNPTVRVSAYSYDPMEFLPLLEQGMTLDGIISLIEEEALHLAIYIIDGELACTRLDDQLAQAVSCLLSGEQVTLTAEQRRELLESQLIDQNMGLSDSKRS